MRLKTGTVVMAVSLFVGLAVACQNAEVGAKPITKFGTEDYHSLVVTPGNPDRAYFGHHGGIMASTDGGKTWMNVPSVNKDAMSMAIGLKDPQTMYLAGHEVFMKSEDGGRTWRDVQTNLPGLDLHWFATDPDDSNRLFALAMGHGLFQSADGGARWTPWRMNVSTSETVSALAILGGEPVNVLAGAENGDILLSVDGGAMWRTVGKVEGTPKTFALNPDAGTVYVGTTTKVFRSVDRGITWVATALDTSVAAVAAGGRTPERVLVVNEEGELFRSDDGGKTW